MFSFIRTEIFFAQSSYSIKYIRTTFIDRLPFKNRNHTFPGILVVGSGPPVVVEKLSQRIHIHAFGQPERQHVFSQRKLLFRPLFRSQISVCIQTYNRVKQIRLFWFESAQLHSVKCESIASHAREAFAIIEVPRHHFTFFRQVDATDFGKLRQQFHCQ